VFEYRDPSLRGICGTSDEENTVQIIHGELRLSTALSEQDLKKPSNVGGFLGNKAGACCVSEFR